MIAAIEIQDAALVGVREKAAAPSVASPGYAVLDRDGILTGAAAQRKSRLHPRHCYTRFWDELDRDVLPRPFPARLTRADLAYTHLSAVWKELGTGVDEAILLAPGFYTDDQLALLLGIARSCGIPAVALVDLALAAALGEELESAVHLDVHLHRVSAARVVRNGGIHREEVVFSEEAGLVALENAWAQAIAEKFVLETRFDPLHLAETEQRLYDGLSPLLEKMRRVERASFLVQGSSKLHSIEISKEEILRPALPFYRAVLEICSSLPEPSRVLLSPGLASLPGLVPFLEREIAAGVIGLAPGASGRNALAHRSRLPGETEPGALPFVTGLAIRDEEAPPVPAPAEAREGAPTHLLYRDVAHPLDPLPFWIGTEMTEGRRGLGLGGASAAISRSHCAIDRIDGRLVVEDRSRYGTWLNGERIGKTAPLCRGDRLRIGNPGIELLLVEVVG